VIHSDINRSVPVMSGILTCLFNYLVTCICVKYFEHIIFDMKLYIKRCNVSQYFMYECVKLMEIKVVVLLCYINHSNNAFDLHDIWSVKTVTKF